MTRSNPSVLGILITWVALLATPSSAQSSDPSIGLRLEASSETGLRSSFPLGAPVTLNVSFLNGGATPLAVGALHPATTGFDLSIRTSTGKEVPRRPWFQEVMPTPTDPADVIPVGGTKRQTIMLDDLYDLHKVGAYEVEAVLSAPGVTDAASATFRIAEPPPELAEAARALVTARRVDEIAFENYAALAGIPPPLETFASILKEHLGSYLTERALIGSATWHLDEAQTRANWFSKQDEGQIEEHLSLSQEFAQSFIERFPGSHYLPNAASALTRARDLGRAVANGRSKARPSNRDLIVFGECAGRVFRVHNLGEQLVTATYRPASGGDARPLSLPARQSTLVVLDEPAPSIIVEAGGSLTAGLSNASTCTAEQERLLRP